MSDQPADSEIIAQQSPISAWREADVVIIKQEGQRPGEEDHYIHVAVSNTEAFVRAILARAELDLIIKPAPRKRGDRA